MGSNGASTTDLGGLQEGHWTPVRKLSGATPHLIDAVLLRLGRLGGTLFLLLLFLLLTLLLNQGFKGISTLQEERTEVRGGCGCPQVVAPLLVAHLGLLPSSGYRGGN